MAGAYFYGMPGVISGALALMFAALVLRAAPRRLPNRALALILAVEGLALATGSGLAYLVPTLEASMAIKRIAIACVLAGIGLYLFFLSTIPAPIVRWLTPRPVRALLLALAALAPLLGFLFPGAFMAAATPNAIAGWETRPAWALVWTYRILGIVMLFGLVAIVSAWRAAPPGSVSRSRAKGYAAAFGLRDASFGFVFLVIAPVRASDPGSALALSWPTVTALTSLAFVSLLAYVILRTQLFDIDLRIKRTIRSSTLAAGFIAVFFVASELTAQLLTERFGTITGMVAAGGLVFALAPLQRLADRVSDVAMPRVQPTGDYLAFRKLHVYRAAVEGAIEDGEVSPRERSVLARLSAELGITTADAQAVEDDVRASFEARAGGAAPAA